MNSNSNPYGSVADNDNSIYDATNSRYGESMLSSEEIAAKQAEYREQLDKLEEEINTLRTVLSAKVQQASELKRKLGITPYVEFKQDLQQGIQTIKDSQTYQKTNEKFHNLSDSISSSDAYQKTNAALKSFGEYASKKMGDIRSSNAFKSVEDTVGGAYSSVKQSQSMGSIKNKLKQLTGSYSEDNFDEALAASRDQQQA